MKKKAIPPFSLTAGQSGRLLFNFTLPEGAETPALRGALMVHGERVDMEGTQEDMLTIPALPAGVYLAEVRAAGVCVLYGHVEVLPSPLFAEDGLATYRVDVDNSAADVLQVNITLEEGLPGPQGESAYETWLSLGNTGSEQDFVDSLVLLPEENNISTGRGTDNINWRWVAIAGGLPDETYRIRAIRVPSRTANADGLSSQPLFLSVWMGDGNGQFSCVAVSNNAVVPLAGMDAVWEFDAAARINPGSWLRLCPTTDPSKPWQGTNIVGGRIVEVSDGSNIVGANGANYGGRLEMTLTYETMREKYAAASHVDDVVVHLSAEEHAALAELLAGKDELLALL